MDNPVGHGQRFYKVEVTFANDGEVYGGDTHYLELDGGQPDRAILDMLVEESRYDDERIPDRSWATDVEEIDDVPEGAVIRRIGAEPAGPTV